MGHIFISYSSKDRSKTKALATAFETKGWKVWWDKNITPGKAFDRAIGKALDEAHCIVVLWSPNSVESDWVLEEAYEGLERNILIPVLISPTRLPFGYRRVQYVELTKWKGNAKSADVHKLMEAVAPLMQAVLANNKKAPPIHRPDAKIKSHRTFTGGLDGKTIVFTGTLSESRDAHSEKVKAVGANFVDTVSGKTDFLVVGKDPGAVKLAAAEKHSIKKITEKAWLKMLNETYRRTLDKKTLVFTGKMDASRPELEQVAKKLGARITDKISGKTDFLVVGQKPGAAKLKAAENYSVKVISETLWKEIAETLG